MIVIPDEEYFDFYREGFTASVWLKSTQKGNYGAFSKITEPTTGWSLGSGQNGNASYFVLREAGVNFTSYAVDVMDGQWHFLAGQYEPNDPSSGTMNYYIDGELYASEYTALDRSGDNDQPVLIGVYLANGSYSFAGLLDDARLYSYPLSALQIASLYTVFATDETVCIEQIPADLNGDCRVNFVDFAIMAARWLDCNLVPDCQFSLP